MVRAMQFMAVMTHPVQITFRNLDHGHAAVEDAIRKRVERLERLLPDLEWVSIVVERPHAQHRTGNLYQVGVHMALPHTRLFVGTDPGRDHTHEDVMVAVGDAFRAARRAAVEWRRAHRLEA
jgi:hypothetical protein